MSFKKEWITTKYGPDFPGVKAEIEALTKQKYLRRIAEEAAQYDLRIAAIEKLEDQKTLVRCAQADPEPKARIAAIRRITDPAQKLSLAAALIEDRTISDYYRVDALEAVLHEYPRAQEELRAVIARTQPDDVFGNDIHAAKLLDDPAAAQKVYLRAALENPYSNRLEAVRLLTDDSSLLEVVRKIQDREAVLEAAARIRDPRIRELACREIALGDRFPIQARFDAAQKVDDDDFREQVFREILPYAEAGSMRGSGTYVWQDKTMASIAQACRSFLEKIDGAKAQ